MVPIITDGNRHLNDGELINFVIETCKSHKKEGRALAFAFIIYDFEDYAISEILNNKSYWSSLDKISGRKISVFYINSQDSYYSKRQEEIYQEEQQRMSRNAQNGVMSYFVPIRRKPTPLDNAVVFLKKEFQIDENIKTPFVLFFQIDDKFDISDSFILALKQEKIEDAFLELRNHIQKAVNSLENVLPENYGNHKELFNLIKNEVVEDKFYLFVKKQVKDNLNIESILKIVRFFFSGM